MVIFEYFMPNDEEGLFMKTEQITLALAIAREGSVSKAAESLFISQPTASNMLKSLECELGFPLIEGDCLKLAQ